MIRHIEKLRLEKGDILVCRDIETLKYLSAVRVPGIDGVIPLVFSPNGIQKLTRTDLLNLLEQLEETHHAAPLGPIEQTSVPL